jgi:glycosyltransferase involved in cell wall biosynthesis
MSKLWLLSIVAFVLSILCLIIFGIAIALSFAYINAHVYFGYLTSLLIWPLIYLSSFGFLAYFVEFSWILFILGIMFFLLGGVRRLLRRKERITDKRLIAKENQKDLVSENRLKLAVIIPAYNEEGRVGHVIETISKDLIQEIIVIDDHSTDNTVGESLAAGATVIRHVTNRGVGAAIKTGYKAALQRNADIIVVVAGDGQHDPKELPVLVEPILMGEADYVVGERLSGHPIQNGMPRYRYIGNRFLSFLTSVITDYDVKDAQCGYIAISRDALKRINLEFLSDRWGIPNDILVECSVKGLKVKFVPITTIYGTRKSYISLPRYILRVITLLFRGTQRKLYFHRGVYLFNLTGLMFFLIGVIYGFYVILETLRTGVLFGTGSVVLVATLIISSFQLVLFGFLSDIIKMIETRNVDEK